MDEAELINAALIAIGEEPLIDVNRPRNKGDRALLTRVTEVRQQILQKQRWSCALAQYTVLPEVDAAPPVPFARIGALPPDFLAIWDANADVFSVRAERRIAWSGPEALVIEYAADRPYSQLDPLLRNAIACRLAALCYRSYRGDNEAVERLAKEASRFELEAAARDALNRREEPLFTSNWQLGAGRTYPRWMP